MGVLINNIQDVAEKVWGTEVEHLEHDVYKYTLCGAWICWDENWVQVGSIVEGTDAEFERTFEYPFDSDEMDHWIGDLEKLTSKAWKDANMNELMVCLVGGGWLYFKTESEDEVEATTEFITAMENTGINCDNLLIDHVELRDPWGNDIN